ncbi:major facilitator superfamily domain-containing protein [Geranomyces variabilis]|nr:major facilitator superfamily domain-containing protein [Geranomyces variabilis]
MLPPRKSDSTELFIPQGESDSHPLTVLSPRTTTAMPSGPRSASPASVSAPSAPPLALAQERCAKQQATLLLLALVPEGILEAMLIPLYPFIVRSVGIPESQVGYYTGLLGSAFYAPLLFTNIAWGAASDRLGRKPILLAGLSAGVISASLLTFGTTFTQIFAARVLAGMFGSNSTISKGMLGELFSDDKGRSFGYAMYGVVYGASGILGPLLAGALVNPHTKWPALFGGDWWADRPFALACGLGTFMTVCGLLIVLLGLREPTRARRGGRTGRADPEDGSLSPVSVVPDYQALGNAEEVLFADEDVGVQTGIPRKKSMDDAYNTDEDEDGGDAGGEASAQQPLRSGTRSSRASTTALAPGALGATRHPLLTRRALLPVGFYCAIAFINMLDMSALPLFFSATGGGGLALPAGTTARYLSTIAVSKLIGQLTTFRIVLRQLGKWGTFAAGAWSFAVGNVSMAFLVILFSRHAEFAGAASAAATPASLATVSPYVFLAPVLVVLGMAEVMGYLAVILAITDSVEPHHLGLIHGFASTCAAATRTLAPTVAGTVWQWGLLIGGPASGAVFFFGGAIAMITVFIANRTQ